MNSNICDTTSIFKLYWTTEQIDYFSVFYCSSNDPTIYTSMAHAETSPSIVVRDSPLYSISTNVTFITTVTVTNGRARFKVILGAELETSATFAMGVFMNSIFVKRHRYLNYIEQLNK